MKVQVVSYSLGGLRAQIVVKGEGGEEGYFSQTFHVHKDKGLFHWKQEEKALIHIAFNLNNIREKESRNAGEVMSVL